MKELNEKEFLSELCMWLSHQKGAIPQDYAKDLARIVASKNKSEEIEINDELTEEDFYEMSDYELLCYAGDFLGCFVDERWQSSSGKSPFLMLIEEINQRTAHALVQKGISGFISKE